MIGRMKKPHKKDLETGTSIRHGKLGLRPPHKKGKVAPAGVEQSQMVAHPVERNSLEDLLDL